MLKSSVFVGVLFIGLALIGCGAQSGSTVVKYEKGKPTAMTAAPADGKYALYSSTDMTPKVTYKLREGDPLGFRQVGDQVVAVAGTYTFNVEKGLAPNYYWKHEKD